MALRSYKGPHTVCGRASHTDLVSRDGNGPCSTKISLSFVQQRLNAMVGSPVMFYLLSKNGCHADAKRLCLYAVSAR
jgi:hypothetical protein